MVQSVALKRPRGGVGAEAVSCAPGLASALVHGALFFTCPMATAAPEFRLHCLGVVSAQSPLLPERSGWLSWAILRGHIEMPGAAGQTHILRIPSEAGAVFCWSL